MKPQNCIITTTSLLAIYSIKATCSFCFDAPINCNSRRISTTSQQSPLPRPSWRRYNGRTEYSHQNNRVDNRKKRRKLLQCKRTNNRHTTALFTNEHNENDFDDNIEIGDTYDTTIDDVKRERTSLQNELNRLLANNNGVGEGEKEKEKQEIQFLQNEISRLDMLEEIMVELEDIIDEDDDNVDDGEDDDFDISDLEDLDDDEPDIEELQQMERLLQQLEIVNDDQEIISSEIIYYEDDELLQQEQKQLQQPGDVDDNINNTKSSSTAKIIKQDALEEALMQGVVPADAGVGSNTLPGDFGFDPLDLATKDYIGDIQRFIWNSIPDWGSGSTYAEGSRHGHKENTDSNDSAVSGKDKNTENKQQEQLPGELRPKALILRDYREAEIRHGRIAMAAAIIWPLQEMLDKLLLDDDQFYSTTIIYGGTTLPYFSLLMTAILMLLGYLDIYANAVKDMDSVGEAFLPGDCFWDPLQILTDTPQTLKNNMIERELFNGRLAMLAIACYAYEETTTHMPLISIPGNELLFYPLYQVPYIQSWLDTTFTESYSTAADVAATAASANNVVESLTH